MTTDSTSRPHTASNERFQHVVLPAAVELIKSAIANSVLNAENAPSVVENIANAVAGLVARPGVHDHDSFSVREIDFSGVPLDIQKAVKNYQQSYLSRSLDGVQPKVSETPIKRKVGRRKKVKLEPSAPTPVMETRPQPLASASATKIASPTRDRPATPSVTARTIEPVIRPVQEGSTPSLRVDLKRRKADTEANPKIVEKRLQAPPESSRKLPKGLHSINEAIQDDYIVCLDDGRKVKDLEKHLDAKGVTMESYLKKWDLPSSYPRRAPKLILTRGTVYEYNIHSGEFEAN